MECLKELEFLKKILDKCHIENKVMGTGELVYDKLGTVYSQIMNKKILGKTFSDFFPDVRNNMVYRGTDDFLLKYIMMKLEEDKVFVVGPYIDENITDNQIMEMSEKTWFFLGDRKGIILFLFLHSRGQ